MEKERFLFWGIPRWLTSYKYQVLGFSFVLLGMSALGVFSHVDNSFISASLLGDQKINKEKIIKKSLEYDAIGDLQSLFGEGAEQTSFFDQFSTFEVISDVKVQKYDEYYFISFFASHEKDDVLHPYFAVFSEESGFFWDEYFSGKILKEERTGVMRIFTIKNTSVYPWQVNDEWEEEFSGKKVALQSLEDTNENIVFPGESVKIIGNISGFPMIKNKKYGFLLLLEK